MAHPFSADEVRRFLDKVTVIDDEDSCWLWTGGHASGGYGQAHAHHKNMLAHRFSYMLANGVTLQRSQIVCHQCDTPLCVRPSHLFVGVQLDNMGDASTKGRLVKRVPDGRGDITASDIPTIIGLRNSGQTYPQIAARYGVHTNTINSIFTGHSWKRVAQSTPGFKFAKRRNR